MKRKEIYKPTKAYIEFEKEIKARELKFKKYIMFGISFIVFVTLLTIILITNWILAIVIFLLFLSWEGMELRKDIK